MNIYPEWWYSYHKRDSILAVGMRELLSSLIKYRKYFDIGLEVPLSQISKTRTELELSNRYLPKNWKNTQEIPLVIFSSFPNGVPILAVFDKNYGEIFTQKHLNEINVQTLIVESFDACELDRILDKLKEISEDFSFDTTSKIVGYEHFTVYSKFNKIFKDNQKIIILNEFRLSKLSKFEKIDDDDYPPISDPLQEFARTSSLDMLVADLTNGEPLFGIEYDGTGHWGSGDAKDRERVNERDRKKNEYCRKIGFPLIRVNYDSLMNNHGEKYGVQIKYDYYWGFIISCVDYFFNGRNNKINSAKYSDELAKEILELDDEGFLRYDYFKHLLEVYKKEYDLPLDVSIEKSRNGALFGNIRINEFGKKITISSPVGLNVNIDGFSLDIAPKDYVIRYIYSYLIIMAIRRRRHDFISYGFEWMRY